MKFWLLNLSIATNFDRESEEFESIVSVRLEGLLKEAYTLLDARKAEKQALAAKLKGVISILEEDSGES